MHTIEAEAIEELKRIRNLKKLYYIGDLRLLKRRKVSIVGSRRPTLYAKEKTFELSSALARRGVAVVSGAAMGVDAAAHRGAGAANTIAVVAGGLDIKYPSINRNLIQSIEEKGLVISRFEPGFRPAKWSFVVRNEIVVALGEVLVITEADMGSGSIRSAEYALKAGKKIYVLPHKIDNSKGTNRLLKESLAEPIYDIEEFADMFGNMCEDSKNDEFLEFCRKNPTFEEALQKFGERVFEAELEGDIEIKHGKVFLIFA
ncbi:DNA-processing protein DprA [Nitrosophilus alvini]|uniref:DNA-processing protein DprA n=1 Tax=Nitrosophilus alvini TaxID=2714855 RepID=UPI001F322255|nr:DNA-processing protein DprA [Nitrosophilus alvini]